jgi:hypothetical protein
MLGYGKMGNLVFCRDGQQAPERGGGVETRRSVNVKEKSEVIIA